MLETDSLIKKILIKMHFWFNYESCIMDLRIAGLSIQALRGQHKLYGSSVTWIADNHAGRRSAGGILYRSPSHFPSNFNTLSVSCLTASEAKADPYLFWICWMFDGVSFSMNCWRGLCPAVREVFSEWTFGKGIHTTVLSTLSIDISGSHFL